MTLLAIEDAAANARLPRPSSEKVKNRKPSYSGSFLETCSTESSQSVEFDTKNSSSIFHSGSDKILDNVQSGNTTEKWAGGSSGDNECEINFGERRDLEKICSSRVDSNNGPTGHRQRGSSSRSNSKFPADGTDESNGSSNSSSRECEDDSNQSNGSTRSTDDSITSGASAVSQHKVGCINSEKKSKCSGCGHNQKNEGTSGCFVEANASANDSKVDSVAVESSSIEKDVCEFAELSGKENKSRGNSAHATCSSTSSTARRTSTSHQGRLPIKALNNPSFRKFNLDVGRSLQNTVYRVAFPPFFDSCATYGYPSARNACTTVLCAPLPSLYLYQPSVKAAFAAACNNRTLSTADDSAPHCMAAETESSSYGERLSTGENVLRSHGKAASVSAVVGGPFFPRVEVSKPRNFQLQKQKGTSDAWRRYTRRQPVCICSGLNGLTLSEQQQQQPCLVAAALPRTALSLTESQPQQQQLDPEPSPAKRETVSTAAAAENAKKKLSAAEGESGGSEQAAVRKQSTYLNVSLSSLVDDLTVISYNVQMLVDCCSLGVNWWAREQQLTAYIRKIAKMHSADVIVFQECWSDSSVALINSLAAGEAPLFPFQTRVVGSDSGPPYFVHNLGDCYCTCGQCCRYCSCCCCCCAPASLCCLSPAVQRRKFRKKKNEGLVVAAWDSVSGNFQVARRNGGVMIVSKWPLEARHAYVFRSCRLPDCLENKGAALVRVNKCGKIYNVVGTHLQSGENHNHIRLAQLRELANWLRGDMEACETEEVNFASDMPAVRPDESAEATVGKTAEEAAATHADGNSAKKEKVERDKKHRTGLPEGLIKAAEPLLVCGDLNLRLLEDRDTLLEAIRPDGLNCRLCLANFENAPTSYDTVLNDTCCVFNRAWKEPKRELIDYFLLSNDHAGSVARWQETIEEPADVPFLFRSFSCFSLPCYSHFHKVKHLSDHLPICVTIKYSSELD